MIPHTEQDAPAAPFDYSLGASRRLLRWILYVAPPVAALAVVLLLRPRPHTAPATGHEAMGALGADSARPVQLSIQAAERIWRHLHHAHPGSTRARSPHSRAGQLRRKACRGDRPQNRWLGRATLHRLHRDAGS